MAEIESSCPNPSTLNALQLTGFVLSIEKLPNLTYWCKDANIPDISLPTVPIDTPFSKLYHTGDKADFGTFEIRFYVDERMDNYYGLWTWIYLTAFPDNYEQITRWKSLWKDTDYKPDLGLYSGATLTVKGANSVNVRSIYFEDLHITNLASLSLTDESTDTQYLYGNASFSYRAYKISECLL